jgi:hypothetical protein
MRLGIGGSCKAHRLFVLAAPGWQHGARFIQRFAQTDHVAVPEDREHPAEQLLLAAFGNDSLRSEIPDERLSRGQPSVLMRFGRQGHVPQRRRGN